MSGDDLEPRDLDAAGDDDGDFDDELHEVVVSSVLPVLERWSVLALTWRIGPSDERPAAQCTVCTESDLPGLLEHLQLPHRLSHFIVDGIEEALLSLRRESVYLTHDIDTDDLDAEVDRLENDDWIRAYELPEFTESVLDDARAHAIEFMVQEQGAMLAQRADLVHRRIEAEAALEVDRIEYALAPEALDLRVLKAAVPNAIDRWIAALPDMRPGMLAADLGRDCGLCATWRTEGDEWMQHVPHAARHDLWVVVEYAIHRAIAPDGSRHLVDMAMQTSHGRRIPREIAPVVLAERPRMERALDLYLGDVPHASGDARSESDDRIAWFREQDERRD